MSNAISSDQYTSETIEVIRTFVLRDAETNFPGSKTFSTTFPFDVRIILSWGSKTRDASMYLEGQYRAAISLDTFSAIRISDRVANVGTAYEHQVKLEVRVGSYCKLDSGWKDFQLPQSSLLPSSLLTFQAQSPTIEIKVLIRKHNKYGAITTSSTYTPPADQWRKHLALAHQNLDNHTLNDLAFILYRGDPCNIPNPIGKVYANKTLLSQASEHFEMCELALRSQKCSAQQGCVMLAPTDDRFDAKDQLPISMPKFRDFDPDGDADYEKPVPRRIPSPGGAVKL
jgi:hypothetical protein